MNFYKEYEELIVGSFIVVVAFVLLTSVSLLIDKAMCNKKYNDYSPEYSVFGGCRVVWDGKLTPVENIGLRSITQ